MGVIGGGHNCTRGARGGDGDPLPKTAQGANHPAPGKENIGAKIPGAQKELGLGKDLNVAWGF